ncbi:MAG: carboxymuconolactone decarboxylase family protein [Thermoleophilia bacterium]|jgi:alkylhydroperoxidase/carboxymuconolactone decarboxylase family protein YurZ|nr:carboxymuconolactone decarboxylase family protein [Thermoleophilia bacterium]
MSEHLPHVYERFREEHHDVWEAQQHLAGRLHEAGPLDERARRLAKLGIAVGAQSEGAVRSHARKALAQGIDPAEIRHVVLLAVTTAGFPAAIAAFGWVNEVLDREAPPG